MANHMGMWATHVDHTTHHTTMCPGSPSVVREPHSLDPSTRLVTRSCLPYRLILQIPHNHSLSHGQATWPCAPCFTVLPKNLYYIHFSPCLISELLLEVFMQLINLCISIYIEIHDLYASIATVIICLLILINIIITVL